MDQKNNKQMTSSNFGKWGWSIILYAFLLYYFMTGLSADAMNVIPDAYAGAYGLDRNLLLSFAIPAGIVGVIGGVFFGRLCSRNRYPRYDPAAVCHKEMQGKTGLTSFFYKLSKEGCRKRSGSPSFVVET